MTPGPATFTIAQPADPIAKPAGTKKKWSDLDMPAIVASLKATGVYAPADQVPALKKVVAKAKADGHDLNLVVLEQSYVPFTVFRDIATNLQEQVGGTVIVRGANAIGTSSSEFSRVQLEDGASSLKGGMAPAVAMEQLYDRAAAPHVDWTLVTLGLIVVVVIGAVLARLTQRRRRRGADAADRPGADRSGDREQGAVDAAAEPRSGDEAQAEGEIAAETTR
ncbi:MAG: hypothetical protein QM809_13300 [Gordonia sp. (in: high G+C Gram-positive bacteria)]|uniref:Rv1476 family membrane protein n=1 Tax=Gordonia sp. (in: high G+C Gram-positive bacteria) TaxID=84139 RepID=UPI0039E25BC4